MVNNMKAYTGIWKTFRKKKIQEKLSQESDTCIEIGRITMSYLGTKGGQP